ncbi:hypothetical protein I4U23_012234 [Adineta vaga]|nr:hypothetical protein I4U23_012234 [Adineta vaga]
MSMLSTNWLIITEDIINPGWNAYTKAVVYGDCNCGLSYRCTEESQGMMIGCYSLEALLRTTTECF